MENDVSVELVTSQLRPRQQLLITEETIEEIQKLAEDPDYGEEFLDCYVDHLNVLKDNPKRNHDNYLEAVKFFSLVEGGNSLTDAYIKVFPHRFSKRTRGSGDKKIMRGEASRYNNTQLVNEIRKVATIPVQLIHRHLLHEAILSQAKLMRTAKSEMIRQKAGEVLIRELKPTEDQVISVKVDDGSKSVIEELRQAAENLAIAEDRSGRAGVPIKQIAESVIIEGTAEVVDE